MSTSSSVDVCIVGGGPAGLVCALLLSQQGHRVLVLEKEKDFTREYRGEVLMPRFTQMFSQIGLKSWLETINHLKLSSGELFYGERRVGTLDFSAICPEIPYALWMPQTGLLQGLHQLASKKNNFEIWFGAAVKRLIKDETGVRGVEVTRGENTENVSARVVVGCDGRWSSVAKDGGFEIEYEDYKFDVLWFTIPKPKDYKNTFKVLFSPKRSFLLLPKYPDAIQVGILVPPHELQKIRAEGIESLKKEIFSATPLFHSFADNLKNFTPFHPLQAHLHFVKKWAKNGCLLIGDAAHCCSPAGAIGVSMAVGSAIQAADVIHRALRESQGILSESVLSEVQKLREKDVRNVHRIQKAITGGRLGSLLPIQWVLPTVVALIARTRIFRKFQRQLMTLERPLPISAQLRVTP